MQLWHKVFQATSQKMSLHVHGKRGCRSKVSTATLAALVLSTKLHTVMKPEWLKRVPLFTVTLNVLAALACWHESDTTLIIHINIHRAFGTLLLGRLHPALCSLDQR